MSYTIITGASSGIGLSLAYLTAEKGHDLILVARSGDKLKRLKQRLEQAHDIHVVVQVLDLSKPESPSQLYDECQRKGLVVDGLVNNAGFGDYGPFDTSKTDVYHRMVQLNVASLTTLTALFLKDMQLAGKGRILNVGSVAAFQPIPNFAVYAATKAYVMQFTEALHYELRGSPVTATLLSPGVTETEFVKRANMGDAANAQKGTMDASTVALMGYNAMMAGKLNVTPGWQNKLLAFGSKIMPSREILLRIASVVMRDTGKS